MTDNTTTEKIDLFGGMFVLVPSVPLRRISASAAVAEPKRNNDDDADEFWLPAAA